MRGSKARKTRLMHLEEPENIMDEDMEELDVESAGLRKQHSFVLGA